MPAVTGRFWRLTLINILTNLTVPLTGLVDTAMLGHLDELDHLGGVALASIIFDYLYWGFGFMRMGSTSLTAAASGRRDMRAAFTVLYRYLCLAAFFALVIIIFKDVIGRLSFELLEAADEVSARGRQYYDWRIWAVPAVLFKYALVGWLLGLEKPAVVLLITFSANAVNIVLDWLFIYRLQLGSAGAGMATAAGQYVSVLPGLWAWFHLQSKFRREVESRNRAVFRQVFDPAALLHLLRFNGNLFVRTLCLITSFAVFLNFSSAAGRDVLIVNTIIHNVITFAAYLSDGAAYAVEVLAGRLYAAGHFRQLKKVFRLAFVAGFAIAAGYTVLFMLNRPVLLPLLTAHTFIIEMIDRYIWWVVPYLLLATAAYILDGIFIGLGRTRLLAGGMLVSLLAGFLPAALYAHYSGASNHWLWLAMCGMAFMRMATLAAALVRYSRNHFARLRHRSVDL